jgi:hypothetical protein
MMKKFFTVICVTAVCLLTACGGLPSAERSGSDEAKLVLDAIAHAQRVASASPDDQRRDVAAAAQVFSRERSTAARLRYGLLLSLPTLPNADPQRAIVTLEPLSATGTNGPVRQFSTLLLAQINERQKEQRRAQQLKEQLDELRAIERALIERGRPTK